MDFMKKVGRSLFGRKKKSKKTTEEPTATEPAATEPTVTTGEPSTEVAPPAPEAAPVAAAPAVERELTAPVVAPGVDGKKTMLLCCIRSKSSPFLVLFR